MKRSGKFYRKNEQEVMRMLGLKPTKNSGSGWIEKEDGMNEHAICQLKSTDANSMKVNLQDLQTLEYNASVAHKVPVFAIQFLGTQDVWLMVKPENLQDAAEYIETGEKPESLKSFVGVDFGEEDGDDTMIAEIDENKKVKSCWSAREKYNAERSKKFRKEKKSAL